MQHDLQEAQQCQAAWRASSSHVVPIQDLFSTIFIKSNPLELRGTTTVDVAIAIMYYWIEVNTSSTGGNT